MLLCFFLNLFCGTLFSNYFNPIHCAIQCVVSNCVVLVIFLFFEVTVLYFMIPC